MIKSHVLEPTQLKAHSATLIVSGVANHLLLAERHLARLVGDKGLEPLREHMILSHARLPIPPIPHMTPVYIWLPEKRYAKTSERK